MKKMLGRGYSFVFFFFLCLFAAQMSFSAGRQEKNFDIAAGDLKATFRREEGAFTLYKLRNGRKNRYDPILDTRSNGASTRFSVSVNGKTYVLEREAFGAIGFEASDGGDEASFIFTHENFEARQRFYIEENSVFGPRSFALAIETTVENTTGCPITVAWRALLDTELGDYNFRKRGHFVTDSGQVINAETFISTAGPNAPHFLFSFDKKMTCAISLGGADSVYAASWSSCNSALRAPFDRPIDCIEENYLRFSDSAILMSWPKVALKGGESASVTLYISAIDASAAVAPPVAFASDSDAASDAFSEKMALYMTIAERLRQVESGEIALSTSEIDELNRILDFLLDDSE